MSARCWLKLTELNDDVRIHKYFIEKVVNA